MDIKKYKDNGLSGLVNLGNTCYMNSVVQVLSHTYELDMCLDNWRQRREELSRKSFEGIFLVEWMNLMELMWKENAVITPNRFVKCFHKIASVKGMSILSDFSQNDVSEFLIFLVDCLHHAICRSVNVTITGKINGEQDKVAVKCFETLKEIYEKEYSEIQDLFYGVEVSFITDNQTGQQLNMVPSHYFVLNLSIPQHQKSPSLYNCIDLYVATEVLEGENGWKDETTGEKKAIQKRIQFWSFPKILVIDIKRASDIRKKNRVFIDFPLTDLNLSKYIVGYNKDTYIYDLYGVCNHHGGTSLGGHYTSFVKNANGSWYHYNDASVTKVEGDSGIVTANAYCFFYRRRP